MVYRIYVEKKPHLANEAKALLSDLTPNLLLILQLTFFLLKATQFSALNISPASLTREQRQPLNVFSLFQKEKDLLLRQQLFMLYPATFLLPMLRQSRNMLLTLLKQERQVQKLQKLLKQNTKFQQQLKLLTDLLNFLTMSLKLLQTKTVSLWTLTI